MPEQYLATGRSAGEELSSTYEGRHLTLAESELAHPTHADGFVDTGDPVIDAGGQNIVGVALLSAAAATDLISLDTEGIWFLTVTATDEDGNNAVQYGDEIFISLANPILSKNRNKNTHQHYGYALGTVASGTSAVVAVKVHWDPDDAVEEVGDSASWYELPVLKPIGRQYRYRSNIASGDSRGMYMALALAGGASGEAVRARTVVEATGVGGGVHGLHGGVEFGANGTITGLAAGVRATYMALDANQAATICGGMSELWAGGTSTDYGTATVHSIHRFANSGDATGAATADNVFEFVGLSATQYAANTDTPAFALRVIINGNVRYIMVSEAQA